MKELASPLRYSREPHSCEMSSHEVGKMMVNKLNAVIVRRFEPDDAPRVCEIYYRSVHEVARARYSEAQLNAWAPNIPEPQRWMQRLCEYETFVAINDAGTAVGWIAMDGMGYIDMLFCLPEATKGAAATALYAAVERVALERGIAKLTAHASLLAQSFFKRPGWLFEQHESILRNGIAIPRAAMLKLLAVSNGPSAALGCAREVGTFDVEALREGDKWHRF